MVTKKDILELKRRFKKEDCTFTRMSGCYVDGNKEKLVTFHENFLNLEDEEFFKYLEIAKKALSGTIGNNILELHFEEAEEESGGLQQFFMGLRASGLKNEELADRFFDQVIAHYDYVGNYLIVVFHDAYDVITKTNDNLRLDESEEVYEYLLCAICPVCLSKPGLGYRADEHRIGPRIRDWVVGAPDTGFLFPAFSERSADIHSITYYVKDAKDSHPDFVAETLGCGPKRTATEQKQVFSTIVKKALAPVMDDTDEVLLTIQENFHSLIEQADEFGDDTADVEPTVLSRETVTEVLQDLDIPNEALHQIEAAYDAAFSQEPPVIEALIDTKALEANEKVKQQKELALQVQELKQQLIEKELSPALSDDEEASDTPVKTYDVVLRVKPEKADQIKSQVVNGKKCLIIPMDDGEYVNLNGINTQV